MHKIYHRYIPDQSKCQTYFNESAVTDHIAKAGHVIDREEAKVVSKRIIRNSDVKEAIRISHSPRDINRDRGEGEQEGGIKPEQHLQVLTVSK